MLRLTALVLLPTSNRLVDFFPVSLLALALFQKDFVLRLEKLLLALILVRPNRLSGLTHPVHDIPQRLGFTMLVCACGLGTQHGCAVYHCGMDIPGDQHGHVTSRRHEMHENVVLALGSGHEDGADDVAGLVHDFDDLVRLQGNELHGRIVVQCQAVDAAVTAETNNGSFHVGVGDWATIAEEIAVEEKVSSQPTNRWSVRFLCHFSQMLVEVVVDVGVEGLRQGHGLLESRMGFEDVFQKLTRGRLASLSEPVVGDQNISVWAPDTVHKYGLLAHSNVTSRCAGDGGKTGECLRDVV